MFCESWLGWWRTLCGRLPAQQWRRAVQLHIELLEHRQCPSGSYLLVADWGGDQVLRYDEQTGAFVDTFVPKHSGGINQSYGVVFGPDGNGDGARDLYVSTGDFGGPGQLKAVLRFDGVTGAFIDEFTTGGDLQSPQGIIFGPDGNLYVTTGSGGLGGRVARYDGTTGVFLGDFVPIASSGLRAPDGIVFGPSGKNPNALDLYVSSAITNSVLRYDGTTGAPLGEFVAGGSGGLDAPQGLTFGPDGNLYVASFGYSSGSPAVLRFQGPSGQAPGAFVDAFVPTGSGGLKTPFGLIFGPDGNGDGQLDLYVANSEIEGNSLNGKNGTVKRYDGVTGAFIDTFVTARQGGLDDPGFLTFTETDPVTLAYLGTTKKSAVGTAAVPSGNAALLIGYSLTAARDDGRLAEGEAAIAPAKPVRNELVLLPKPWADSTIAATAGTYLLSAAGGLYLEAGGSACLDSFTLDHIFANHASTSDDDLFGEFDFCE